MSGGILTRAPEELKRRLQEEAKEMGVSLNALTIYIFWEWLNQKEKEQ